MLRFCLVVALSAMVLGALGGAALAADESNTHWGVGLGIPYGIVGANVEAGEQTRLSVGAGYAVAGMGWALGVKHYFRPIEEGSASVCLYYGTTTLISDDLVIGSDDELETGFAAGLGWTKGHFDIGLLVPFGADIPEGAEDSGPAVKVYVGYRF
jgi:hypothetical protein